MRIFAVIIVLLGALVGYATRERHTAPAPLAVAPVAQVEPISIAPTSPLPTSPGSVDIARGANGHFTVDGSADGTTLSFIVDTGASAVSLGREDARRIGLWVGDGDFDGTARTATETIRVAHRTLPRLRIGAIEVADVPVIILDVPDATPLLGQSFLRRIARVTIQGDRMTLTQP
jgi:aspartyl protease family protein